MVKKMIKFLKVEQLTGLQPLAFPGVAQVI